MNRIDPNREIRAAFADGSREFAMLAHDIRNALQGVIGGIERVGAADLAPAPRVQLDRVSAAAQSLAEFVGAAIGDGTADGGPVETARLLRFIERRWTGEAAALGLAFRIEAGPDLPVRLGGGFARHIRILGNLIGNALKFSDAGAVVLGLRRLPDGALEIEVLDEGPGLQDSDTETLFAFGHRHGAGERSGQGIGLHIVKALCDEIGAPVVIADRPAGGVRAAVTLPPDLCEGDRPDTAERRAPTLAGTRILLAEDNPTNQMVASQMLRSLEAEVTVASDGIEALEIFDRQPFDLVLVDIEMPRLSGLEVTRAIRARSDPRARVPVVALTAYAMREHRDRIAAAGADGLISKPIVSVDAFGRALAGFLRDAAHHQSEPAAAPREGPAESPAVDMAVFDALSATIGPEMMGELLEKVDADLVAAERALGGAIEPLDVAAIRASSHILISVAGAIGAGRLQHCARRLNQTAHSGEQGGLPAEIRVCLAEIEAAVDFTRGQRAAG